MKTLLVILLCWVPMMILSSIDGDPSQVDIATHVRFLISIPLYLLSYPIMSRKFKWMLVHFGQAEIIQHDDVYRIEEHILKLERVLNSLPLRMICILLSYFTTWMIYRYVPESHLVWRSFDKLAGKWFYFISLPVFYYVSYWLIFHIVIWWTMMFSLSRLRLSLKGAHGDGAGGLGFLSTMLNCFLVPGFAFSCSSAAGTITLVKYGGLDFPMLKYLGVGILILELIVFVSPLFFFSKTLLRERERSIHKYGVFTCYQLADFDQKWLEHIDRAGDKLNVGDFSSATDNGSEVERVHDMKLWPVNTIDLTALMIVIILPFLPVFSLKMPWGEILEKVFGVLHFE